MSQGQGWGPHGPHGYGPPQGHYPPPGYGPPGYPPPGFRPPQKKTAAWVWILLAIVAALSVIGIIAGGGKKSKSTADDEDDSRSAIEISAVDLFKAYEENEVAADKKYKNRKIEVTGVIVSIDSDFTDDPVVRLEGANQFQTVMLNDISKDAASELKKGDRVVAVCKGGGEVIGSPVLRKCKLQAE